MWMIDMTDGNGFHYMDTIDVIDIYEDADSYNIAGNHLNMWLNKAHTHIIYEHPSQYIYYEYNNIKICIYR
jgi:hypothetical protein